MNDRGSLLVGMMLAIMLGSFILLLSFLVLPRYTNLPNLGIGKNQSGSESQESGPGALLRQAGSVKVQADLKNLQVSVLSYYAQQGAFPDSLPELVSYMGTGVDTSNLVYMKCSEGSAILYHNSSGYPGYKFNFEQTVPTNGSSKPSCF